QLDETKDSLRESQDRIEQLRRALDERKAQGGAALNQDEVTALGRIVGGRARVADYLRATVAAFPEQVVALPTALKSGEQIPDFEEPEKVGQLLWVLATTYRAALVNGKGDNEARMVFGSAYAARESEVTRQNPLAKEMRTFDYRGERITMEKHLK